MSHVTCPSYLAQHESTDAGPEVDAEVLGRQLPLAAIYKTTAS
jgi:hypothetical protein